MFGDVVFVGCGFKGKHIISPTDSVILTSDVAFVRHERLSEGAYGEAVEVATVCKL